MSEHVIITGLPNEAVFPKLVFAFRGLLKKIAIRKFWIRELTEAYGPEGKQMTVEFTSHAEARKARGFFHNLPFIYGNMEYQLKARMAAGGPQMETDMGEPSPQPWGRGRRGAKREQRPRSQSPGYRQEASKLDMEIELLRKQRLVIEEERRLLLEQKKLEMIREYGPGASRELDQFDDFDAYEPPRKRRHPEPVQATRPRKWSPLPAHKPQRSRGKGLLPVFFQPCKKLIADMKPFIEKDTTSEEAGILVKLIRAAIRKSLAVALDGKDYMPSVEIVQLYREKHPKQNDEQFVAKILANIRASYLTDTKVVKDSTKTTKVLKEENCTENQKNGKGNVTEKQIDNKNEGQGDQVTNDKVVSQETPANEENGTDAAPNFGIQVKSETITPQKPKKVTEVVSKPPENVSDKAAQEPEKNPGEVSREPAIESGEVSQEPKNISDEVAQAAVKVSDEVAQEPEKVSEEVAPEPVKVSEEVAQEPEKVSEEVAQEPEKVSEEVAKEPEKKSNVVAQETEKVSGEVAQETDGPAEAVKETNDAAEFDKEFDLEDKGVATDLLTEGDLQDADDWVEEQ